MKLGKAHRVQRLEALDNVLYSGPDDPAALVSVPLTKLDPSLPHLRVRPADFVDNKFDLLKQQLSSDEFTRLTATKKIERRQLGGVDYFKTSSSLSVYFYVVDTRRSSLDDRHLLLCFGYGEYQPMRYIVTIVSIHEVSIGPSTQR